ncbi:MAG: glycosyltransferase [Actinobacteria bacterium]|nr:MAG: glycosyltransferase [Actinomycetota bacterium]
MSGNPVVIVAAHNEADRIRATLEALARAFPGAQIVVADDASSDGTGEVALLRGAEVVGRRKPRGKGGNVTAAVETAPMTPIRRRSCSATPTWAPLPASCAAWWGRWRAATATSRSPPSAIASGVASASRSASPAGRSSAAAGIEPRLRSPVSGPCPPMCYGQWCRLPPAMEWRPE